MNPSPLRAWLHAYKAAKNAQAFRDHGTSREPGISDQERRVRIIIEWQNRAWEGDRLRPSQA